MVTASPRYAHCIPYAGVSSVVHLTEAIARACCRSPKPELLRTLLAALTAADSSETARHGNSLGTKVMANGHANGYVNGWMKQAAAPKLSKQQQVDAVCQHIWFGKLPPACSRCPRQEQRVRE